MLENTNNKKMRNREEWIDLLRALAMFLVILGHMYSNKTFYQIINPIKMPLFYFLSGFFIGLNKDFLSFFKALLYRLIVPWFVFSLFPLYVIKYFLSNQTDLAISYIKSFLLGFEVWFIPSFIISQVFCYTIYHILRKNEAHTLLASILCFALGVLLKDNPIFEIWAINTALTGVFFIYLGKLFYTYKQQIMDNYLLKFPVFLVSVIIYFFLFIISYIFYYEQTMDFHNTQYYNILICLIMIIAGISFCIYISSKIKSNIITRIISIMGENTLVVYLLNGPVVANVARLFYKIGFSFSFVNCFIISIIACLISTVVSIICGKVCPALIGKKNVRNT